MTSLFPHNPLYLAKEAQQMAARAKGTDCEIFQKVALVSMCVMAAAGASQILRNRKRHNCLTQNRAQVQILARLLGSDEQ